MTTLQELFSSSIPNFTNGVSQQPYTLRMASQGESQENGFSSAATGLQKRPNTVHLKQLTNAPVTDAYTHAIYRDSQEKYQVIITNGDLRVFDANGVEKTVAFPQGKTYLNTTKSAAVSFGAVSVADHTFIVNKTVVTTAGTTTSSAEVDEALINVKLGNYGKKYAILINGVEASSFTTPDGSDATKSNQISTDYIATQLHSGLNGSYGATLNGSLIRLTGLNGGVLQTIDGFNNTALIALQKKVQKFSDLPANPKFDNMIFEVSGDGAGNFDNYWVTFNSSEGKAWKETVAPGSVLGLNAATMPHKLVREADGSFTFAPIEWADRTVGSDTRVPNPSFVDGKITNVFFYRDRLGFLTDESLVLSESGEYFNFFRTTLTTLLDSEPIDVTSSHTKVSRLTHAVPFEKQLYIFSPETQFILTHGETVTPKNVGIKVSTEYPCSEIAPPVPIGNNIVFVANRGSWSTVREYYTKDTTGNNDSTLITGHVDEYIPKGITKITASLNEDLVCFLSEEERDKIYVYKFYWSGNEKLQSSWSWWSLGSNVEILSANFIESELLLLVNRPDGLYMEKIDVSPMVNAGYEQYKTLLDRRVYVPKANLTYSEGYTYINTEGVGYALSYGAYQAVVPEGQPVRAGVIVDIDTSGETPRILGDYSGCDLIIGQKYKFRYVLSPILPRTASSSGEQKAVNVGRLQLRRLSLNYSESGSFTVKVTPVGRKTYSYMFSGYILGATSVIGKFNISSGKFSVPINARNTGATIEIENDTPLPCTIISGDWEGFYVKRSSSM